jgi:hypothetical protein
MVDAAFPPLGAGGTGPGTFFYLPAVLPAWRWDPTLGESGEWVEWHLPPEEKQETLADIARGIASRIGRDAPNGDQESKEKGETNDESPTSASDAGSIVGNAVGKFRDNIKWFAVAGGAVAAALIGTTPLAGASASLSAQRWTWSTAGIFLALMAVALILTVVAWTSQPIEMSLPQLSRGNRFWIFPRWRHHLHEDYAADPDSFLDSRARNLKQYNDYRSAWLGTLSDIDRLLDSEGDPVRRKRLTAFRELANDRIKIDTPNVVATVQRGIVRKTQGRSRLALVYVLLLSGLAAAGFLTYLAGAGQPPAITSLKSSPESPTQGSPVDLSVQTTGSGFTYEWWHGPDPLEGEEGPVLTINDYTAESPETYTVRVTGVDGKSDVESITLLPPW